MKNILLIILSVLLLIPESVYAACTADVPAKKSVFPLQGGNITVGDETPIGAVIYRQTIHAYKDYKNAPHMKCTGMPAKLSEEQYMYFTNVPMPLSSWQAGPFAGNIYATNVPGIGAVITNSKETKAYGLSRTLTYARTMTDSIADVQMWGDTKLLLIKTGVISPGLLSGVSLPTVEYQDIYYDTKKTKLIDFKPYVFSFGGSLNVVAGTCKTKDYTVELGSWEVNNIKKSGHSEWRNADLLLEECPTFHGLIAGVTTDHVTGKNSGLKKQINTFGVTLNGLLSVIDSSRGIINIETTGNSASGIGIQIALGEESGSVTPVILGSKTKIDAPTDGRRTITIPLRARYIKTNDTVTPGVASGYAVFRIDYY